MKGSVHTFRCGKRERKEKTARREGSLLYRIQRAAKLHKKRRRAEFRSLEEPTSNSEKKEMEKVLTQFAPRKKEKRRYATKEKTASSNHPSNQKKSTTTEEGISSADAPTEENSFAEKGGEKKKATFFRRLVAKKEKGIKNKKKGKDHFLALSLLATTGL